MPASGTWYSVPFSTELEHTRACLAVEQAQYDDMLFVDYDTPHTALENIRQRLEMMCKENLEVMSRDEGGTGVIVKIPDRQASGA